MANCVVSWLHVETCSSHSRPYNDENTASRSLSEVKHHLSQLVLRWGTTLESWVLTFCSFLTLWNSNLLYYLFSKEPNIFSLIIIWDTLRNQSNYHHYLDHGMIFKLLFPHNLTNNTYKIKNKIEIIIHLNEILWKYILSISISTMM